MCFTFAEGGNDYDYFDSQLCEDYDFHEGLYSCYYLLRIFWSNFQISSIFCRPLIVLIRNYFTWDHRGNWKGWR